MVWNRTKDLAQVQVDDISCPACVHTDAISPLKNAAKLNEIGQRLAKEYGVEYLISDFKKKNGYKRSTELSKIYGLYRQDYCGCEFSQRQRK